MEQQSKNAFIFPGQGSQSPGMCTDFVKQEPVFRDTFSEASAALGIDLWAIVRDGPEETLNSTDITQPALLTAGVATWRLWQQRGGKTPHYMAGHSLGEYTALVCAGSIEFCDAVTLVRDRGIYMQEAVPAGSGAMAAIIGLGRDDIIAVCEGVAGLVSAANFNSPEQTVIAGEADAVIQAMAAARAAGAKRALQIPVSVPSHCQLMKPAAERLAIRLQDISIKDARIPVVQNVDATPHQDASSIQTALVSQLHQPVLWADSIDRLAKLGCHSIIESGPGKVLAGLIKRINRELDVYSINTLDSFNTIINEGDHGNQA